ncbi:hypothetical protein C4813_23300 [Salmonella enterica subsp. enterica serovar Rubislaw]|nr:hypothetical protein C4813_23300 [Salmonella enterica subsp. enterica serovar Rubislaw]
MGYNIFIYSIVGVSVFIVLGLFAFFEVMSRKLMSKYDKKTQAIINGLILSFLVLIFGFVTKKT